MFWIPFFLLISRASWVDLVVFGCHYVSQVYQKIDHMASCWQVGRNIEKTPNLQTVLHCEKSFKSLAVQLQSKIGKKRFQADQKLNEQIGWRLDPIFDGF